MAKKRWPVTAAYVLEIQGDIEPKLRGPYKTPDNRDRAAQRLRRKDGAQENGIFALDVMPNHKIQVSTYSGSFLNPKLNDPVEPSEEDENGEIRFLNHYKCPDDGTEWTDEWSCMCNDRCPTCDHEIEPYESQEINPPIEPLKSINRPGPRKDARKALRDFGA